MASMDVLELKYHNRKDSEKNVESVSMQLRPIFCKPCLAVFIIISLYERLHHD